MLGSVPRSEPDSYLFTLLKVLCIKKEEKGLNAMRDKQTETISFKLDEETTNKLKKIALQSGISHHGAARAIILTALSSSNTSTVPPGASDELKADLSYLSSHLEQITDALACQIKFSSLLAVLVLVNMNVDSEEAESAVSALLEASRW